MKKSTLRGYLLEEALAYLIRTAGYTLLINPKQDIDNLRQGSAGIEVRGRGGWHQADVLGQLEVIPAFTYPFRLFTEAKFYEKKKVDMPVVRSAVGIVTDVNQAPCRIQKETNLPYGSKYSYSFAIFSTSGFSPKAVTMATSYFISLIDLNMDEYRSLLQKIDASAQLILQRIAESKELVKDVRYCMRSLLETIPARLGDSINREASGRCAEIKSLLTDLVREIKNYDKLYIGTVNAPFILVLKADDPQKFEKYAEKYGNSSHKVEIHWASAVNHGNTWFISPVASDAREKYKLSFRLPSELSRWIFEREEDRAKKAMRAKLEYFSSISVYIRGRGIDHVVKLQFDPVATLENRPSV